MSDHSIDTICMTIGFIASAWAFVVLVWKA